MRRKNKERLEGGGRNPEIVKELFFKNTRR
jgi:hypothetical protein